MLNLVETCTWFCHNPWTKWIPWHLLWMSYMYQPHYQKNSITKTFNLAGNLIYDETSMKTWQMQSTLKYCVHVISNTVVLLNYVQYYKILHVQQHSIYLFSKLLSVFWVSPFPPKTPLKVITHWLTPPSPPQLIKWL